MFELPDLSVFARLVPLLPRPRGIRPVRAVALATDCLAGCSVIDPVPVEPQTALLWQAPHAAANTAHAASAGSSATGAFDPMADAATCHDDGRFVGGLAAAICEVDLRRLAYLRRAAAVVNGNANYNAALWPLGAAAVFEKLRGAPNAKLLLPATLGAAAYGFVTSGIPEREKIYLEASRQLGCAIVSAAPDLVEQHEIDPLVGPPLQSPPPLRAALVQLDLQIEAYDDARAVLLADLKPRPGTAATSAARSGNVFDRWSVQGGGRAAIRGDDKRTGVATETRARLVHARTQLSAGQALLRKLESGAPAAALRGRAAHVDATLYKQLADKAPAPANPASAAGDFNALARAMLTLQGSLEATNPAAAASDPLETALPHALFDGLAPDSQAALRKFQQRYAAGLRKRTQHVSDWLASHAAARQDTTEVLKQAGCSADGADAVQDATKSATDVARKLIERAKTSNSPDSAAVTNAPLESAK